MTQVKPEYQSIYDQLTTPDGKERLHCLEIMKIALCFLDIDARSIKIAISDAGDMLIIEYGQKTFYIDLDNGDCWYIKDCSDFSIAGQARVVLYYIQHSLDFPQLPQELKQHPLWGSKTEKI